MALLGSADNLDRYRSLGYDAGKPWSSVHFGNIFETSGIVMRRKLVEAHADLIESERIKDLESIVEGLRLQILRLESIINERNRNC